MQTKIFALIFVIIESIKCSPFDDGKYIPTKYKQHEGMYSRPLTEGKYIPGDEGRYTYIYRQGLYPSDNGDYRYIHIVGPNGPGDGPGGPGGPDGPDGPGWNDYIGHRIYAEKYPYIHDVIEALVDKFVSKSYVLYGDESGVSESYYRPVEARGGGASAVKCKYVEQRPPHNESEKSSERYTDSLPDLTPQDGEEIGEYYNFKGLKSFMKVSKDKRVKKIVKLQYDVSVRVIDEIIEVNDDKEDNEVQKRNEKLSLEMENTIKNDVENEIKNKVTHFINAQDKVRKLLLNEEEEQFEKEIKDKIEIKMNDKAKTDEKSQMENSIKDKIKEELQYQIEQQQKVKMEKDMIEKEMKLQEEKQMKESLVIKETIDQFVESQTKGDLEGDVTTIATTSEE